MVSGRGVRLMFDDYELYVMELDDLIPLPRKAPDGLE